MTTHPYSLARWRTNAVPKKATRKTVRNTMRNSKPILGLRITPMIVDHIIEDFIKIHCWCITYKLLKLQGGWNATLHVFKIRWEDFIIRDQANFRRAPDLFLHPLRQIKNGHFLDASDVHDFS